MLDRYNRTISYLRVSVTDLCNLRCTYCMIGEEVTLIKHSHTLSIKEIFEIIKNAVRLGITKVRLTGGEPLVHKGILSLGG